MREKGLTLKKLLHAKRIFQRAAFDMRDRYMIGYDGIYKITDSHGRFLKKPKKISDTLLRQRVKQ